MIDLLSPQIIARLRQFFSIRAFSIRPTAIGERSIIVSARRTFASAMAVASITFSGPLLAEEIVVADDGSEILLRDDGSWVQLSRDRHATSRTGERIKLSPDGSWQLIEDNQRYNTENSQTSVNSEPPSTGNNQRQSLPQINTQPKPFAVLLRSAEILTVKSKTLKSSRVDTRTVYHLSIKNRSQRNLDLTSIAPDNFKATFSNGRDVPVLAVEKDSQQVNPNETATLRVVADGSPRWFNIKYISIAMAENTIAEHPEQILSINLPEVTRRSIESF